MTLRYATHEGIGTQTRKVLVIEIIKMHSEKIVFVNSNNLWKVGKMLYLCSRYEHVEPKSQLGECP